MVCFPGCHGGEGREEGVNEGEVGEGLGRREEDTSVGESTKSTVHVRVTCMTYACTCTYMFTRACLRYCRISCCPATEHVEPFMYTCMCKLKLTVKLVAPAKEMPGSLDLAGSVFSF